MELRTSSTFSVVFYFLYMTGQDMIRIRVKIPLSYHIYIQYCTSTEHSIKSVAEFVCSYFSCPLGKFLAKKIPKLKFHTRDN